ncbi:MULTISPECIES: hypothetical protein [Cysteiniphilum]|uniref:hypothetical protein n=1 Tax=Cysteiniphilum TaxID=2056696 RepID=UPI001783CE4C|nr:MULTISPECIES: hypothetical protein [Cysteiniphilum]
MATKKRPKPRKKSGKIKSWRCHLRCDFTKPNDTNTYIERCSVTVGISNLAKAKETYDLHDAVADWLKETREDNDYTNKFVMVVERWEAMR